MRRISIFTLALVGLSAATLFTGCSKEEAKPKPSITVEAPKDGATVVSGVSYDIKVTASANAGLKNVIIKVKNGTSAAETILDSTFASGSNTYTFNSAQTAGATGTEVITITVTDRDNVTETSTVTLTVGSDLMEVTGAFYHISGKYKGAYDLVNGAEKASTDAEEDKDMKNTDAAGTTFTGSWTTGTSNTSKYLKANSFDYTNATKASITAAYNAGTSTSVVAGPALNDIYVAKLRNNAYAVVKITAIDPNYEDPNNTTVNKGKITFSYKK